MSTPDPALATSLAAVRVRRRCNPERLTVGVEGAQPGELLGQRRAAEALAFGLTMTEAGFNVFAAGPPGTGKATAVRTLLEDAARRQAVPPDWCYVHNFVDPARPRALRLPAGQARRLRDNLAHLVQAARREIPRAFESEEYIAQREAIIGELEKRRGEGFTSLNARAQLMSFTLQPTPAGLVLVPTMGNRPVTDEMFAGLPADMRATIERNRVELDLAVRGFMKELRVAERTTRERLEAQDREVALHAVGGLVEDLADDYADQPEVSTYLDDVREGILADIPLFRAHPLPSDGSLPTPVASDDPNTRCTSAPFASTT